MFELIFFINYLLRLYIFVLIATAVFSWLVAFNVVNTRNRFVYMIGDFLHRATDPVLKRIRRVLPNLGGLDISPIVLILGLFFIRRLLIFDVAPVLR